MALEIPLFNDLDDYTVDVQLDGTTYSLRMHWNGRAAIWFCDVYLPTDDARVPICMSCPCVIGSLLILGVWDQGPRGQLTVIGRRDPERYDWGVAAKMLYITADEITAMAGGASA